MSRDRVIPHGSGRIIRFRPNELTVKTESESGHALVGVFESALPPGGDFPIPHVHEQYEEVFYVLEGEIEYYVGEEWEAALAGSTISVPSGVIHAFRNSSPYRARRLVVHAPVTALTMIGELAQAAPHPVRRNPRQTPFTTRRRVVLWCGHSVPYDRPGS